jgi:hypothetical protein
MTTMNAINWPQRYVPGTTDNFVSNEQIAAGIGAGRLWPLLVDTSAWTSYYDNVSDIAFPGGDGPILGDGTRFSFSTFGFPPLHAEVIEFAEPGEDRPARLSWTARQGGSPEEQLDVLHAWLIEDLPGGRVRVLTQESQIGQPAAKLSTERPNPMLNGHQAWIDGLIAAARSRGAD